MLLVRTTRGISPLHGLGCFAAEFIPEGTAVWQFRPGFDLAFSAEEMEAFPPGVREQVLHYGYLEGGKWILCGDDARFINHSEEPTLRCPNGCYAIRDIQVGEELTEDYRTYGRMFTS